MLMAADPGHMTTVFRDQNIVVPGGFKVVVGGDVGDRIVFRGDNQGFGFDSPDQGRRGGFEVIVLTTGESSGWSDVQIVNACECFCPGE